MELAQGLLRTEELAALRLRELYERAGCRQYRMARFEEYGLYQENRSFLPSEQVLTFTDLDGRLLALKPDVTLSIAKSARPKAGETLKFYYSENVYRPSAESHTFREISQMGLEYIGEIEAPQVEEMLRLALASMATISSGFILELSHMGFVSGLLDALKVAEGARAELMEKIRGKNAHELRAAALAAGVSAQRAELLKRLLDLSGEYTDVLGEAFAMAQNKAMEEAVNQLAALTPVIKAFGTKVRLDLSLCGDMEYYNGLVFQGYLAGVPRPLLKGGRYDLLAQKLGAGAGAIGFALYLDELNLMEQKTDAYPGAKSVMLNVALPKGRLGDQAYRLLESMGYGCGEDYNAGRKLVVENLEAGIRYFLVKPSDVAIYVEHGAADVGIVGKDILEESAADVYELLDTGLGRCRMCVAGPQDYRDDPSRPVRVATKFVDIAKAYYASVGRDIDIIKLNGSIELAPLLGLSDVIVDIVETGTTLKENGLCVLTEFMPISARLIANKASYQFKNKELCAMATKLQEVLAQ